MELDIGMRWGLVFARSTELQEVPIVSTPADTRSQILTACKAALLDSGYARLSTRRVADTAGVPLSQIHYHFGSRQNLVLAVLAEENARLLERQTRLYQAEMPLWRQWEQACDFLDDDLRSGYVRVLQEMTAAGWSDAELATAVRSYLAGWFDVLTVTASTVAPRFGDLGPFTATELATLVGAAFLGIESMILLGFDEDTMPCRSALRSIGFLLRTIEERHAREIS
jgi:AcrR family transcriptional regulator